MKLFDVPAQFMAFRFNVIDGTMCLFVFPGVGKVNNVAGKFLDAPCVVSECHDILPSFAGWVDGDGPSSKTPVSEHV